MPNDVPRTVDFSSALLRAAEFADHPAVKAWLRAMSAAETTNLPPAERREATSVKCVPTESSS